VGKVRIFIKKEGRMLKIQNEDLVCFYRVVGKNKRIKFPDSDFNAVSKLSKYLEFLGGVETSVLGAEDYIGWKEVNKGDRF
jgi:hypothetical protein